MKKLTEIYNVVNFRRNKAKDGFIRPTLGQLFKPRTDFVETIANIHHGNDEYTKLLLHMDENEFIDSSSSSHTIIVNGGVTLNSSEKKYGVGSAKFENGTHLLIPNNYDFNFGTDGDYTIDFWMRNTVIADSDYIFDLGVYHGCCMLNGTKLSFYNPYTGFSSDLYTQGPEIVVNTWYHVAFVRNSGVTTFYLNGVSQASGSDNFNYTGETDVSIGRFGGGGYNFNGYLDEFRVSKVARWVNNFDPPSEAYT